MNCFLAFVMLVSGAASVADAFIVKRHMLENGGKIRLRADTGDYFGRADDNYIVAESWTPKASDYFTVHSESDGTVTLQADNGKYLSRVLNGGMWYIMAVNDVPVASSYFKVHDRSAGVVSLEADNGYFLGRQFKIHNRNLYLVAKNEKMNGYNCECKLRVAFL